MRLPRMSANGWLLVVFGMILLGMIGEPAYRAITGRKSSFEQQYEKQKELAAKYAAGPSVGEDAPPFTLKSEKDGHKVSLSDFRGRRVVMTFYCGCSYCREVAKSWEKLQKEPLKGNPVFLGICHFAPDRLAPFIKDTGAKDLLYVEDPGKQVALRYGSPVCPRTWVVDENGKIAYRHEESMTAMLHSPVPKQVETKLASANMLAPSMQTR
jgi:thioredoxin-dependent peroxiredoxin